MRQHQQRNVKPSFVSGAKINVGNGIWHIVVAEQWRRLMDAVKAAAERQALLI